MGKEVNARMDSACSNKHEKHKLLMNYINFIPAENTFSSCVTILIMLLSNLSYIVSLKLRRPCKINDSIDVFSFSFVVTVVSITKR